MPWNHVFHRRSSPHSVIVLALIGAYAAPLGAQANVAAPATLNVTSSSAAASKVFFDGLTEAQNLGGPDAVVLIDEAIRLDPGFGMALATKAFLDGSLSPEQRNATFARAFAALGNGTPAEIAFATAMREMRAGNRDEARRLIGFAAREAPGDANIAMYRANWMGLGAPAQVGINAIRTVTERFPNHGPAFNILAYGLYRSGDTQGALEAVRTYLRLESDHWNAHDSMAEMMAWEGRFDDALTHYGHVVRIAPTRLQGFTGQAEVYQLMGRGADARGKLTEAMDVAAPGAATINLHRAIGNSFALDGDLRNATRALGVAASMATEAGNANLAALAHQEMAMYTAILGRPGDIAGHVNAAKAAGGPAARQAGFGAMAYAINGNLATAKSAASELAALVSENSGLADMSHQVNALIKLREGDAAGAKTELGMADPSNPFTKVVLAETYKAMGQNAAAMALKQDVLGNRTANLYASQWIVPRMKAAKIK